VRVKQVGRCLTNGVTYDKKKAYELARASCEEIKRKLEEAQRREERLKLEAREEEKARTAHLAYRKEVFEKYREADKKLVLARAHIRKDSVSVGTQVAPEDLKTPSEESTDLEKKLRGKLERVEERIQLLVKTLPGDYAEAKRAYVKKHPEVRECYEQYAEKARTIRKRLREECGVDVSDTREATEDEQRQENNRRRRELRTLRKEGKAAPAVQRAKRGGSQVTGKEVVPASDEGTVEVVPASDEETVLNTNEEPVSATGENYPVSPVSEFNWDLLDTLECPLTPGRE
jgi:hypothetical protein